MNEKSVKLVASVDEPKYIFDCPFSVNSYKIEYDFDKDRSLMTFNLKSESKKVIKSVYFKIVCYDDAHDIIGTSEQAAMQNVNAESGASFGSNSPIILPSTNTVTVEYVPVKVVFTDGEVWRAGSELCVIPYPEKVAAGSQNFKLYDILKENTDKCVDFIPKEYDECWVCSCGAINKSDNDVCTACESAKSDIMSLFDETRLSAIAEAKRTDSIYSTAKNCDQNSIDALKNAIVKLQELDGYKDSKVIIEKFSKQISELEKKAELDAIQLKYTEIKGSVNNCTDPERYDEAAKQLLALGKYKNSVELAKQYSNKARDLRNVAARAQKLTEQEKEKAAQERKHKVQNAIVMTSVIAIIAAFVLAFIGMCILAIVPNNRKTYNEAMEYYEEGSYTLAYYTFKTIEDYKDSSDMMKQICITLTGKEEAILSLSSSDVAYSITEDGALSFDESYTINSGELVLPDAVDDIKVTSIADNGFQAVESLRKITLPSTLNTIGTSAFQDCTALEEVIFTDYVYSIGSYAFSGCTSLKEISLPSSIRNIGSYAFYGCTSLKSANVPSQVTTLNEYTFAKCTSLDSIKIESKLATIKGYVFAYCSSLKSFELPDTVKTVSGFAFYYCSALESIIIPDGVTTLSNAVFGECSSLTSARIGSGVSSLGNQLFDGCSSLKTVTFTNSVTSIGYQTFNDCSSLENVVFIGSEDDYAAISVGSANDALLNADIAYNK